MTNKTVLKAALASLVLFTAFAPAHAAPMTYNLAGVTFTDGATASGSFVFDAATLTASAFSVSTTAGGLSAFTFDNTNSGFYLGGGLGAHNFILMTLTGRRYMNFSFLEAFAPAGGTYALDLASSYECMNCSPWRMVSAGSVTTVAPAVIPEPSTPLLMLSALSMLGYVARRRKKRAA